MNVSVVFTEVDLPYSKAAARTNKAMIRKKNKVGAMSEVRVLGTGVGSGVCRRVKLIKRGMNVNLRITDQTESDPQLI